MNRFPKNERAAKKRTVRTGKRYLYYRVEIPVSCCIFNNVAEQQEEIQRAEAMARCQFQAAKLKDI